jgi:hypothetical protein
MTRLCRQGLLCPSTPRLRAGPRASLRIHLIAKQGQGDSPVVSNVPDFLTRRHVADYELFGFYSDPHHGHLRAAV